MRIFWRILVCLFLLIWVTAHISAALYRWTDSNGQIHYSTTPPTIGIENVEVKRGGMWFPYQRSYKKEPVKTTYTEPPSQVVVEYSKRQDIILIDVVVNKSMKERFIVDTGASYTVISPTLAEALNLVPNPKVPPVTLQTAKGVVEAPLVNLDSLQIGGLEIPNVTAAVHEFDPNFAGLLGLNCLNRFNVTVNSTHNQLILEPIGSLSQYTSRDCVAAREWLGRGQALNDHSAEEANCYKKAISLCEDLIEAYVYLGEVYYQQKDYQQAVEQYLTIIHMRPDEPEVHYRLGVLYLLTNRFFQAKREFQKTLELEPNHKEAKEYLEEMKL